jgi:hypothetical protein
MRVFVFNGANRSSVNNPKVGMAQNFLAVGRLRRGKRPARRKSEGRGDPQGRPYRLSETGWYRFHTRKPILP